MKISTLFNFSTWWDKHVIWQAETPDSWDITWGSSCECVLIWDISLTFKMRVKAHISSVSFLNIPHVSAHFVNVFTQWNSFQTETKSRKLRTYAMSTFKTQYRVFNWKQENVSFKILSVVKRLLVFLHLKRYEENMSTKIVVFKHGSIMIDWKGFFISILSWWKYKHCQKAKIAYIDSLKCSLKCKLMECKRQDLSFTVRLATAESMSCFVVWCVILCTSFLVDVNATDEHPQCEALEYRRIKLFKDHIATEQPIWETKEFFAVKCAEMCSKDEHCMSFFHNPFTGSCKAQNLSFTNTYRMSPSDGFQYYRFYPKGFRK